MSMQNVLEAVASGETQFGIDMDDCHACLDCLLKILIAGCGTPMQKMPVLL
jgi:hypothetical protein